MTGEQIGGIVRALVAAAGGYAIGQGWADAHMVASIGGAAATIAVAIWSFRSKRPAEAPAQ